MEGLGEYLRKGREQAGISLETLASRTRIRVENLESLEREDLDSLPSDAYVRGFVRQVCREVGLSAHDALVRYEMLRARSAPPDEITWAEERTDEAPGRLERALEDPERVVRLARRGGRWAAGVAIAAAVVLAGTIGWRALHGGGASRGVSEDLASGPGDRGIATEAAAAPAGKDAADAGAPPSSGAAGAPASAPDTSRPPPAGSSQGAAPSAAAPKEAHARTEPAAPSDAAESPEVPAEPVLGVTGAFPAPLPAQEPVTGPGTEPERVADPGRGSEPERVEESSRPAPESVAPAARSVPPPPTAPAPEPTSPPAQGADVPGQVVLELRAVRAVDVSVLLDGTGHPRTAALSAGESRVWKAADHFVVSVSDGGALRVRVNGRDLGSVGDDGHRVVRTFRRPVR